MKNQYASTRKYNKVCLKLRFMNFGRTVEFESGKLPYQEHGKPESILDIALNFGIQLEHACGGSCACTTCHVHMKSGAEVNCQPDGRRRVRPRGTGRRLTLQSRLGCQAVVKGDVVVEIPSWNRNYVSEGGGSMNLGDAIPAGEKIARYCFSKSPTSCPGQFFRFCDIHAHTRSFFDYADPSKRAANRAGSWAPSCGPTHESNQAIVNLLGILRVGGDAR